MTIPALPVGRRRWRFPRSPAPEEWVRRRWRCTETHRMREKFPDGQLYVNLGGYDQNSPRTPAQTMDGLLHALGMPRRGDPTSRPPTSDLAPPSVIGCSCIHLLNHMCRMASWSTTAWPRW